MSQCSTDLLLQTSSEKEEEIAALGHPEEEEE
jgi:hypothetical protein